MLLNRIEQRKYSMHRLAKMIKPSGILWTYYLLSLSAFRPRCWLGPYSSWEKIGFAKKMLMASLEPR